MNEAVSFPKHNINPQLKGREWCLQAAKAIAHNWSNSMKEGSIFYAKRKRYDEIDDYYMGLQTTLRYMEWQTGEKNPAATWINIDQSIDPTMKNHIQKVAGRLKKIGYNICATPLDSTAKSKLDSWYDQMKVKILMREAAMQANPQYAQTAQLMNAGDEPEDVEELNIAVKFSPKVIRAKDVEQAVSMIFYENDFDALKDKMDEDIIKYGVTVPREYLDENGKVCIRVYNPGNFVCSWSEDGDFKDLTYAGVYDYVTLTSLAPYFSPEELEKIANAVRGQHGNPAYLSSNAQNALDSFRVAIFDFEYKSYDSVAYEEKTRRNGTKTFGKAPYSVLSKDENTYTGEGAVRKYFGKTKEEIYKGKWVVGTDFIYAYGKETNSKRTMNRKWVHKTSLSFLPQAASFSKMRAVSLVEDLMSIANDVQMVVNKMRTLRNTMIVNAVAIDFSALENVAIGDGGENMKPKEVLEMFLQNGVLAYRSEDLIVEGKLVQRKPVEPLQMNGAIELANMWIDLNNLHNKMYEVSGLNKTTDSATVNPKTLVGIANAQNMGTNNALYSLENARRKAMLKIAKNIVPRFQTALLNGDYESEYADVLGDNTIQYFKFAAANMPCDYSLVLEDKIDDDLRKMIVEVMAEDIKKELITSADVLMVMDNYNLKDACMILEKRVAKAKKQREDFAMKQQQMNGEVQVKSAKEAEAAKRETMKEQSRLKLKEIALTKSWDYKIEQLRLRNSAAATIHNNATSLTKEAMKNSGMPMAAPAEPMMPQEEPGEDAEMEMPEMEEPEEVQ